MTPINTITGDWRRKKKKINRITLLLSADSRMPTIRGKWKRLADGKIRAWYTPEELKQCTDILKTLQQPSGPGGVATRTNTHSQVS